MRTLYLVLAFGFSASVANSQNWKLTGHYSLALPRSSMRHTIQADHSIQGGLYFQPAGRLRFISVGAELGLGMYASQRVDQTFQFDNNTSSVVPVNYTSNTFNAAVVSRINLAGSRSLVQPYISLKGGLYNFFSTVVIEDPGNPDGCHALDRKNIIDDATVYFSAGGGLALDAAIFTRIKHRGRTFIDLNIQHIQGGQLQYINTRHLVDAQTVNDPAGKPLEVEFINASTQAIHEHTVARVYTSPLRMLEFRLGVVALLGW